MIFSKAKLETATKNFSKDHLVGEGGFGKVYRGTLRHADVAVKRLSEVRITSVLTVLLFR